MELDDLKNTWNKIQTKEEQIANPEMLVKMKNDQYRKNLKKIIVPEIGGMIICLVGAVFIGFNFYKLNTVLLKGIGVVSILLLLLLPIISLLSTLNFNKAGNVNQSYAATLQLFATQKIRFFKLQKLNVVLSYGLLVTVIVLLPQLFGGKDLSDSKYFWLFSFTTGYALLLFYSSWVAKYYRKSLQQAEELLSELAI